MSSINNKLESKNLMDNDQKKQDQKNNLSDTKKNFWDRDVAYPSALIKDTTHLEKTYQLRYDVYCLQKGFLDPENYPEQTEIDDFDAHSLHFGTFDDLGNALGTIRLVKKSKKGLPMLDHCEIDISEDLLEGAGEISRLAVSKIIRKRREDTQYGIANDDIPIDEMPKIHPTDNGRRHRPDIVIGLYKCLYQESKKQGITHWVAAMEPGLLKLLKRFYFDFYPIGPEVDYYGAVRPYMVSLESIEDKVYESSKEFYAYFTKGLPSKYIRHSV